MKEFGGLTALIIEPNSGMRGNLHSMLNMCGINKIDHAVSSGTAIRPLRNKTYDIILCEYDLVEGQDGQQLLEDLRHNKIIPLWTIFIMVTAERTYQKVVSAAELAPTEYLLKPFTADSLLERIRRALDKRRLFMPTYELMDQGDLPAAILRCEEGEAAHPKFSADFMRLRAELHVILGQPVEAEPIYERLIDTKAVSWARLGLAKTLFLQERFDEASDMLAALVQESDKFLDAYDWLAKTHEATGQLSEAKAVLEDAVAISPHAVRRLRKLGDLALETGDLDSAENSFQQVVTKAKYSEFRDPEDHVRLVRTLVKKGEAKQAATIIRDMDKAFNGLEKTEVCSALSKALLHEAHGNAELAVEALSKAVHACRNTPGISNELKMAVAQSCLENNMEQGASEIMLDVMNNAPDQNALAKATNLFEQAGRKELGEQLVKESRRQVVELVSSGAEKAKKGDYLGALELMSAAAQKLPNNPQVVFNAAVAALKCLENLGWETKRGEQARWYIEEARRIDAANPRLAPLTDLYMGILRKYGISPAQVAIKAPN
jgi:DNA-binding NarL/FixJ family response regulator/Flp pilus assembly protein TadD